MSQRTNPMVLDQLATDPSYAVDFVIDNNPQQVQANLNGLNLLGVAPQDATKADVRKAVFSIDDEETLREVLTVPYIQENPNYTGGYQDELNAPANLKSGQENVQAETKGGTGLMIVNGILTVAGNFLNLATTQEQSEQLAQTQQFQQEMAQFQAQQEERRKVLGFPPQVFIALLGAIVLIVVVVAVKK